MKKIYKKNENVDFYKIFKPELSPKKMLELGVFGGSYFGKNIKEISNIIITNGYIHLIGSDAHNCRKRNFCIKDTYDFIEKKISKELVSFLKNNCINILNGNPINNLL